MRYEDFVNAQRLREVREELGCSLQEAKAVQHRCFIQALIDSPFWFLNLRSILTYLVNRP